MIQKFKCNYCQTFFEDLTNKSGAMTKHLRIKHNIVANKINVFTHFHIIEQQQKELYICPICKEWTTPDIKNVSGIITVHNKKVHNLQIEQYVNLYPQYKQTFKTYYNKKEYQQFIVQNKQNEGIQCQICGEWRRTINHRHLKLHNISISEYKQKYIYDNLGFRHSHNSKLNYFYTKDYIYRQNRFKYRKSELCKMFNPNDIDGLTEQQIMQNIGYDRIWDCGSMAFIF